MIIPESFIELVNNSSCPYLILFWGIGCKPCDNIKPIFEEISNQYKGSINFVSLKVSEAYKLAGYYKVISIPTLILIDKISNKRLIGPKNKEDIIQFIEQNAESTRK